MRRWIRFSLLVIFVAVMVFSVFGPRVHQSHNPTVKLGVTLSPPGTINTTCTADDTAALNAFFAGLSAGSVVNLASGGCYNVTTTLAIHNLSSLTLNGNGSTIKQTVAGIGDDSVDPIVSLIEDSHLNVNHLTLDGKYDGATNGGDFYEGNYGWLLEADAGVILNNDTTENIQGDFLILQAPNDVLDGSTALNTNVTVKNSTFTSAGYHGLTVESANGALFTHDAFSDMGVDAMDFEFDTFSTRFVGGLPKFAAENNITVSHDTWTNFNDDWFASLQGQTPGVTEHNIVLAANTISVSALGSPLLEVTGTAQASTTPQYQNTGLTVINNTWNGANPITGFGGGTTAGGLISNVNKVTISGNSFPMQGPNYAIKLLSAKGVSITQNSFTGAPDGVIDPSSSGNTITVECGNTYATSTHDTPC